MIFNKNILWGLSVLFLSMLSLMTGFVNIFPAIEDSFCQAFNFEDEKGKLLIRITITILFITLPTGIFMDKFGSDLTLVIAIIITILSITSCIFFYYNKVIFSISFVLISFGSCSIFISLLEITLSRSPKTIQGISTSFVCASLSLSYGVLLEIFKLGTKMFKFRDDIEKTINGFKTVGTFDCIVLFVAGPLSYFLYHKFPKREKEISLDEQESKSDLIKLIFNPRYFLILICMYNITTDGIIVLVSGHTIWKSYGKYGYRESAAKWGLFFSIFNCVFTITLSFLTDIIIKKFKYKRELIFSYIWGFLGTIPIATSIIFKMTDNETLFGIFMSLLGIPFGFGLCQIPPILFSTFGSKYYGLLFGIIQISPIISTFTTGYIIGFLGNNGKTIFILSFGFMHILFAFLFYFLFRERKLK